ncbi:hypothetical protein HG531_002013 [Fusarium graminearum]|nr:hypothetical protein HG531_002013 [Fusarium graminearum]
MSLGLADWPKAEAHPSPVAWPSPGMTGRASVVSHWFKACWLILDTQSKLGNLTDYHQFEGPSRAASLALADIVISRASAVTVVVPASVAVTTLLTTLVAAITALLTTLIAATATTIATSIAALFLATVAAAAAITTLVLTTSTVAAVVIIATAVMALLVRTVVFSSLSPLFITSRVRLMSLGSLLVAIATGMATIGRVFLFISAVLLTLTAIRALSLRVLGLTVAIAVTTILYFSSSVRAVIFAATAGLSLSILVTESAAKKRACLVEEATKTALLLLLLLGRRGHLVAGILLNHSGEGASGTLEDGISCSASNLILKSFGATAVQLAHLKLASTAVAVTGVLNTLLVVLSVLDTISGQLATVFLTLTIAHLLPPLLNTLEEAVTTFLSLAASQVALSGMVQNTVDNIIEESIHVGTVVIDGIHELGNDPLNHRGSISTSNLIENLSVIVKDDVLLALTACDDLIGTGLELVADLLDERNDERSNNGEDEDGKLLLQLLNDLGQDRNSLHGGGDALHDVVMELNSRHDLLKDILDVLSELLRVTRRNSGVLHLSSSGAVLEFVNSVTLVLVTEDAIGDLV